MTTKANPIQLFADAPVPFALTEAGEKAVTDTAPVVRPGFAWVGATIGLPGRTQTVMIQCPTAWCTVDHIEIREVAVEDVTHYGPGAWFGIPSMFDDTTAMHEMYVNVTSDPSSNDSRMRAAHLVVANGSPMDAHLTDVQGEELASELERVAADIRVALAVCRASNGDSDPDMDEALRRVRGEAV